MLLDPQLMTKPTILLRTPCVLVCAFMTSACPEPDDPAGPCHGETWGDEGGGGESDSGSLGPLSAEIEAPGGPLGVADELRPRPPDVEHGWLETPSLDGFYRYATPGELRRFNWPDHTLLVAAPFGVFEQGEGVTSGQAWIELPAWQADRGRWVSDKGHRVVFERRAFTSVQTLALGHFVEHHSAVEASERAEVRRPTFALYGSDLPGSRGSALSDSSGALLLRHTAPGGHILLTAPHDHHRLDLSPPVGFEVAAISPSEQDITRGPLEPFSCENGNCEDPDDPLDQCNDGVDNDADGHGDLCDWNCLPHWDFGAHHFPDAQSRVENGKSYALMGGGDLCTALGDTWMVTFADWALQASEVLSQVRPEDGDAVHYRVFSCWVFENEEAFERCQHGLQFVNGEAVYGDSVCPSGMEDYPYKPAEFDIHPGLLIFGEATDRAWQDLELNTVALGPYAEPVNGVGFLTHDTDATCVTSEACSPAAGLATQSSPDGNIEVISKLGRFVVTDQNAIDSRTLAHETGHTLGLLHDDAFQGFMNKNSPNGVLPALGMSRDSDYPDVDNNETWATSFARKHMYPRSSGWRWSGCYEVDNVCSPLGIPGWTCEIAWCEPE